MSKYLKKNPLFWIGMVATSIGIFVLSLAFEQLYREIRFASDSRITLGTVEAKRVDSDVHDGRRSYYYVVSYVFDPLTTLAQSGESEVDEAVYQTLNPGDEIEVEFVGREPSLHRIAGSGSGWVLTGILPPFSAVILALGLLMVVTSIRRANHQSHLWNQSIAYKARIVKFSCITPQAKEDPCYQVECAYDVARGRNAHRQMPTHIRGWFGQIWEGEEIDIVVDPKSPGTSEWCKEME